MISAAAPPGEREGPRSLAGGTGALTESVDCDTIKDDQGKKPVNERKTHQPFIPAWLDDAGLSLSAFRVACHLWRRRNRQTGQCNPSARAIARACCLNRDTVWDALSEIEGAGLFRRSKRGFRSSNQYQLLIPTGGNLPLVVERQLAENLASTSGNSRHPLAEEIRHQGSPLKVQKEGCGSPPPNPFEESQEAWLGRLAAKCPHIDVRAELRKAQKKYPGGFDRGWFERDWLPRVTPMVESNPSKPAHSMVCAHIEPDKFRQWLLENEPPQDDSWHGQWDAALNSAAYGDRALAMLPRSIQERFLADQQKVNDTTRPAPTRACA